MAHVKFFSIFFFAYEETLQSHVQSLWGGAYPLCLDVADWVVIWLDRRLNSRLFYEAENVPPKPVAFQKGVDKYHYMFYN